MKNPFKTLSRWLWSSATDKEKARPREEIRVQTQDDQKTGYQVGYNNEDTAPLKEKFDERCKTRFEEFSAESAQKIERLEPQVADQKKAVEIFKKDIKQHEKQKEEELTKKHSRKAVRREASIKKKQNRKQRITDKIGDLNSELIKKSHLKGVIPAFYELLKTVIILKVILVAVDSPIGTQTIEFFLAVSPLVAWLASVVVSMFLSGCAFFAGKELERKSYGLAFLWCVLALTIIGLQTFTRLRANDEHALLVAPFLLVMVTITALVSKYYHKNGLYYQTKKKKEALEKKCDLIDNQIIDLQAEQKADLDEIQERAKKIVATTLSNKVASLQKSSKALEVARQEYAKVVLEEKRFSETGWKYISQAIENGRIDGKKNNPDKFRNKDDDGELDAHGGAGPITKIILAIVMFSLMACHGDTLDMVHFRDFTESSVNDNAIDCQALKSEINEKADLDTNGHSNKGLNLKFVRLNNKSVPTTSEHAFPSSIYWLFGNRKERGKATKKFLCDIEEALAAHCGDEADAQQTQIYRPVVNVASTLDTTKRRIFYIDSDFIAENTLINLACKRYFDNPSLIIEDYDSLTTRLLNDTDPGEFLRGVEMVFVLDVSSNKENLATMSARLFERLFTERCGASVRYQANL